MPICGASSSTASQGTSCCTHSDPSSLLLKIIAFSAAVFLTLSLLSIAGRHWNYPQIEVFNRTDSFYIGSISLVALIFSGAFLYASPQGFIRRNFDFQELAKTELIQMKDFFDQHQLYYELTSKTDRIREHGTEAEKAAWAKTLEKLNNKDIGIQGKLFHIDTQALQSRLEQLTPTQLDVEELGVSISKNDLRALRKVYYDSFGHIYQEKDLSESRLFVARDRATGTIIGGLMMRPPTKDNKFYFIHSLCRKASVVKVGVTEAIKNFLIAKKSEFQQVPIRCTVARDNFAAKGIYEKIGFREIGVNMQGHIIMELRLDNK